MKKKQLFIVLMAILTMVLCVSACNDNSDQVAGAGTRTFAISEFPNTIGMKWIYTVHDSTTGRTDTATVSIVGSTELAHDTTVRIWVTTRGQSRDTTYVAVYGNTVEFRDKQSSINPEVFIFPLEVNASWGTHQDTSTVVGIESIQTPFGMFNESFHIWRRISELNYGLDSHTWLVPHTGVVMRAKNEYDFSPPVKETWVLISKN